MNSIGSVFLIFIACIFSLSIAGSGKKVHSSEVNTIVQFSSRGYVSLPLLGEVNLKGKTAHEAEILIENKYKNNYIKNPHVSVFVKEQYSQKDVL